MVAKILLFFTTCILAAFADIQQPCDTKDLACIGKYLSKHAKCNPSKLSTKSIDPLKIDFLHLESPGFNNSQERYGNVFTGIGDGVVENFYINTKTDKAVLTVSIPKVVHSSKLTTINLYQTGAEDVTVSAAGVYADFRDVIITITFKSATNLELKDARYNVFVTSEPDYSLGDGSFEAFAENNQQMARLIQAWTAVPEIAIGEQWKYRVPIIVNNFFNHKICRYKKGIAIPDDNNHP